MKRDRAGAAARKSQADLGGRGFAHDACDLGLRSTKAKAPLSAAMAMRPGKPSCSSSLPNQMICARSISLGRGDDRRGSERSGFDEDGTAAVGGGMPGHRGGEFAVEREVDLGGLDLDVGGAGRALGNGADKNILTARNAGRLRVRQQTPVDAD